MAGRQAKSIAFDVFRNGRRVCTAGLKGKAGVLTTIVDWVERRGKEPLALHVSGLESSRREEHILWSRQRLRVGDEVMICIEENEKPTRASARYKATPKSRGNQEREWLRRTAKKHGYKLGKL